MEGFKRSLDWGRRMRNGLEGIVNEENGRVENDKDDVGLV